MGRIADRDPAFPLASLGQWGPIAFAPGDYDLLVLAGASGAEVLGPMRVSLEAGNDYTLLFTDAPGGGLPMDVQLLID